MSKWNWIGIAALLAISVSPRAFAQHVSPANVNFEITGGMSVNAASCTWTLRGLTGPDLGGAHVGHAAGGAIDDGPATGPAICPLFSLDTTSHNPTFVITSYAMGSGAGHFDDIDLGVCGPASGATVPFTIANTGATTSQITINATIGSCAVQAVLGADFLATL